MVWITKKSPQLTFKVSEITNNNLTNADKLKYKDVILNKEEAEKLKQGILTITELSKLQLDQLNSWIKKLPKKISSSIVSNKSINSAKKTAWVIQKNIQINNNSFTETFKKVIVWIVLWFKNLFGWLFWYFDKLFNLKNNDPKIKKNKEKEKNKSIEFTKYTVWINILLWITKKETKESFAILINPKIRKSSYNELWIEKLNINDKNGIWEKYWLKWRDDEVYNTLSLLKWKEDYLDKLFSKNFTDWKNKPLQEVMSYIYQFSKILENIKWITLEQFIEWDFEMFSLSIDWKDEWTLNELLENRKNNKNSKLYWVDNIFLIAIYENKTTDFSKDLLLQQEWANKEFIDNFINFKENISEYISNYFYLWKDDSKTKSEFKEYFYNYNYTQRDILELYVLTNWELNADELNDMEKGLMFMKIFKMLQSWSLRWKTYTFAIKEALIDDSSKYAKMIPESFKNTLLSYIKKTWEKLLDTTIWLIWEIWSMLNAKEKTALISLGIWLLVWFIAIWRFMWMAKWAWLAFAVMAWANIIDNIYDYLKENKNNEFKKILNRYNINSKEEFKNKFWPEIEKWI
jgi:hypothetical protein